MTDLIEREREKARGDFGRWLERHSRGEARPSSFYDKDTYEEMVTVDQNKAIDIYLKQNPSIEPFRDDLLEVANEKSIQNNLRLNKARWKQLTQKSSDS